MTTEQLPDEIRKIALAFGNAVENQNVTEILANFTDDCEIELLRHQLIGKDGVKKWTDWLFGNFRWVKLQPVVLNVEGNRLFEEFIVRARMHSGIEIKSKQAKVLVFEKYKIKSLRLYFDRLDFAESVVKGPINRALVSQIIKKSLKGLT